MPAPTEDRLHTFLHRSDQSVWSTAALIVELEGLGSGELQRAASDVLRVLELHSGAAPGSTDAQGMAARAAAPVHQVAALLRGDGLLWAGQSDEALLAQGNASRRAGPTMAQQGVSWMSGLAEAFATPGSRMLDVGTGVAGLAVSFAEHFPALTVVGIDVLPRVLALAAQTVAASTVDDRVILRQQDVSTLQEPNTYVFAWMPAPFLPEDALRDGVLRVVDALVPGGWLMLAHGKYGGTPAEDAVKRFKTIAYGGTALDDDQAQELLRNAQLGDVTTVPTPPGSPAFTLGRKASQG
jgi:protein-L-isoaspartate O-methyltransferase